MKGLLTITFLMSFLTSIFSQQIVGYIPYYRGYNANYDYSLYTHIHYFAIWPAADGSFIYPGAMDSTSMANQFHQIDEAAGDDVSMVMTFGGTAENGSEHFIELASDDASRAVFIQNVRALCNAWQIDGIDMDWEWAQHTNTDETSAAYAAMMTDIRALATELNISFSVDVSPSAYNGKFSPVAAVDLADYINVMTYSYNGAWAQTTAHHSPLNKVVNVGLQYWLDQGVSAEKLNLGTAFYGQSYSGTYEPNSAFTSMSALTYTQVKNLIDNDNYVVVEDSINGAYCYSESDNKIVYYDSPQDVENKSNYAVDNGYSGIIIWEIGQDNATQDLTKAGNLDYEEPEEPTLGLSSKNELSLNAYPNPANNIVYLSKEVELIEVYNTTGMLLRQETNVTELNLTHLDSGIYILKSKQGDKESIQKIVKE